MVKWLKRHWPALFLLMAALITLYMDVYFATHILDGDTSDYLHRASVMAEQRNPFTRDYYGTTEPRLLDIAFVFSLFMPFVADWTMVRILGTVLVHALYVLSFLFMTRRAGIGKQARLTAAAMLLLPYSTPYARLVLYHAHYTLYLTNAFWMVGLTLWVVDALESSPKKAAFPGCALLLLWIFVGLNGIRHMLILGIPLLVCAACALYQALNRHGVTRLEDLRTLPERRPLSLAGVWVVCCACFLVGLVLSKAVILPYFQVEDVTDFSFMPTTGPERYSNIFNGLLVAIGARESTLSLLSMRGISLAAALFGFGWLMIVSIRDGLMDKANEPLGKRLLLSLLSAAVLSITVILVFVSGFSFYARYATPAVAMLYPVLAVELDRAWRKGALLTRRVLTLLVCLCLLFQGAYTLWFLRVDKGEMDGYSGLEFEHMDALDKVNECIDFMRREGYTYALIEYWYANVMMELTDGEITVAPVLNRPREDPVIQFYHWGTSHAAFENLPPTVVVFQKPNECPPFEAAYPQAEQVFNGWYFTGYTLPSSALTGN